MSIFRKLLTKREADNTDAALGAEGERLAVRHLQASGWRIVERNWRSSLGEVDVICRDGGTLVFVEVKSARRRSDFPPELRVNPRKRRKLVVLAEQYMRAHHLDCPVRFDVLSVWWENSAPHFRHIKHAFSDS